MLQELRKKTPAGQTEEGLRESWLHHQKDEIHCGSTDTKRGRGRWVQSVRKGNERVCEVRDQMP